MELAGTRQRQLLPISRDDIDISKWKDGSTPITMTSLVDGKIVEHSPYDFNLNIVPSDKIYTNNWTNALEVNLKGLVNHIKTSNLQHGNVLEIGCYEGRGTGLINTFFKPSAQVCCDPWDSAYEDVGFHFKNQYENFKHNTRDLSIIEMRMTSDKFFEGQDLLTFDFIYIDGDHSVEQVEKDLNNSLGALRVGGLCLVDDYIWGPNAQNPVRKAVNEFAIANAKKIVRVNLDNDIQYAFMRIPSLSF